MKVNVTVDVDDDFYNYLHEEYVENGNYQDVSQLFLEFIEMSYGNM